jgi:hypothetical protein
MSRKAQSQLHLRQESTVTCLPMTSKSVFSQWSCLKHIKVGEFEGLKIVWNEEP